ncbi:MAG: septum formation initiator family protein [Actinobacteria bacterium]|nr:septum formation initiator family protein [Actinomycetota bacterium]MCG2807647.1 septum formation initiator family protein [Coriobacteriia bacterium]
MGWVVPTSIAILVVIAAWSFYPVARMQYCEQREKQRLEVELASLKERNSKLRAEVDRLKTPEGVEEVARENLGLVKEGENLYVVLDEQQPESTTTAAPDTAPTAAAIAGDSSSWQRALDMIFGFE